MKKSSKTLPLIAVILLAAACAAGILFYFWKTREKVSDENGFTAITLEEFEQYVQEPAKAPKETLYIYVGRDDCPDCQELTPQLQKINDDFKLGLLYYSTSQDRETRPDQMYALLDELKVTEVPMILEITDGRVSAQYSGSEFTAMYQQS